MIHANPSVSLSTGTSRPNRHNAYLNSGGSKTGMELVISSMTITVQCLSASLAFALQKIKETLRPSAKFWQWTSNTKFFKHGYRFELYKERLYSSKTPWLSGLCISFCNLFEPWTTWFWRPEFTPPIKYKVHTRADIWPLCFRTHIFFGRP